MQDQKQNTSGQYGKQVENCKIELLEEYPCENLEQLHRKEGEYIKSIACVNRLVAGRTQKEHDKEHYEANKDRVNQYSKAYRISNREALLEKKYEYREINRDKIQEWYKATRDKILEKQKEYRKAKKGKSINC